MKHGSHRASSHRWDHLFPPTGQLRGHAQSQECGKSLILGQFSPWHRLGTHIANVTFSSMQMTKPNKNMKNKRYAMLVAAVAFIGFATFNSSLRYSQSITVQHECTLALWRRED